ncbi:CASP-like protein 5B3 isoform X2 [Setaria italica]|uniref:CASP-like protein 5B3 isoform X2 n=1 Tax=Setaria italica TaxID=4555 RepID=UPI000BE60546|nr:CASP-like protein 5B3 isoform X2 [Setaria italica]XP_034579247.1 CASP-like protein 5B3 isoform X2 [Setaria viridis]
MRLVTAECPCDPPRRLPRPRASVMAHLRDYSFMALSMSLQLIWSFILACIDIHSLKTNWDLHNTRHVWKYLIGDWVLGIASMAAASSSAGVAILLVRDSQFCRVHDYQYLSCSRYEVSVILAFMAWSFIAASAGSTFWLLVSLVE